MPSTLSADGCCPSELYSAIANTVLSGQCSLVRPMQLCQDGNQNSINRHRAEHAHVRVEGKAKTRTVAVMGIDLACAPARATGAAACTA